jgi:hypothetical protein
MRKKILFVSCILCTVLGFAQDAIYKSDNTKIDCKVVEVGTSEIKYKLTSNPDGPIYVVSKSSLLLITYQNGSHESFASESKFSHHKFDSLTVNFRRNFIGLDIVEFGYTSVGIMYERTFGKKGMFAVRVPFSVSLNQQTNFYGYPDGKIFSTGIDLLYFPTGQGKLRYYAAPYFEYGMFRYTDYYYPGYPYEDYLTSNKSNGQHYAGGIKNGLLFQATPHFCFSADLGLGIQKDITSYTAASFESQFKINLLIGYRF